MDRDFGLSWIGALGIAVLAIPFGYALACFQFWLGILP